MTITEHAAGRSDRFQLHSAQRFGYQPKRRSGMIQITANNTRTHRAEGRRSIGRSVEEPEGGGGGTPACAGDGLINLVRGRPPARELVVGQRPSRNTRPPRVTKFSS